MMHQHGASVPFVAFPRRDRGDGHADRPRPRTFTSQEKPMSQRLSTILLSAATLTTLAACSTTSGSRDASTDADSVVVVLPTRGATEQMKSGCWASFYDEVNFGGDSLTLIGPVELQTLDKGSAKQLKRDIRSVVTGPRATLTLHEKQFLSARWVGFTPDSREPGLTEKLGFGGRIESMKLTC
jgi:hypothetical protein